MGSFSKMESICPPSSARGKSMPEEGLAGADLLLSGSVSYSPSSLRGITKGREGIEWLRFAFVYDVIVVEEEEDVLP